MHGKDANVPVIAFLVLSLQPHDCLEHRGCLVVLGDRRISNVVVSFGMPAESFDDNFNAKMAYNFCDGPTAV
eukprot:3286005-Pleurochrysis_carterae.AAC.2